MKNLDQLKVNMKQTTYVLKCAGYEIDAELLNRLFVAEEKVGSRCVKKVRDSITHSVN